MIKIMIADDQELIRESLKIILSTKEEFRVIATVGSGKEVIEAIRREQPDVILMDMRMPDMDGVHCTKFVKEVYPDVKVIVLTTFDDDEYVYSALKYGASGYLLKGVSLDELSNAIKTVLQGGAIFNPNVASKAIRIFSQMAKNNVVTEKFQSQDDLPTLSNTEWKIIQQVAQGLSNKEIAEILKFTEGTIRNYLSVILDKLEIVRSWPSGIYTGKKRNRTITDETASVDHSGVAAAVYRRNRMVFLYAAENSSPEIRHVCRKQLGCSQRRQL